ncbi:MAG TPA: hypothetical protein VHO94_03765 [Oscillospiraceae bacterium]|nr:hypothetical protein [Oscillospiraceae bacterium]
MKEGNKMNRFVKAFSLFLICLATLTLFGCSKKNAETSQNSTNKTAALTHSIVEFISYEGKIYELNGRDRIDSALVGTRIADVPYKSTKFSCYKIKDVSIDKAIVIKDEYGISKYEYLCDESFVWNKKSYKISHGDTNVGLGDKTYLGKDLGKIGNLEVFESTKDSSGNSLFVHMNGLHDEAGKEGYFLATEITNNTSTSKK